MSMIDNFEAMLAKGQDNALLRYSLGNEYLKAEQPALAVEHLRACLAQDAGYSAAYKLLGKALAAMDEKAEAEAVYEQGIAVAEEKGDVQAAKEMRVFLKRLSK
jgi:predicted Zn-dependent protease